MLEVILKGHEKYYCVSDVVRLFYDDLSEDRDRQRVTAGTGPDVTLACSLAPDGRSITTYGGKSFIPEGDPIEAGREIRRSLYLAMCELAGRRSARSPAGRCPGAVLRASGQRSLPMRRRRRQISWKDTM